MKRNTLIIVILILATISLVSPAETLAVSQPASSPSSPGPFQLSATPQCVGGSPEINLSWTRSNAAARYDVYRNGSYLYNVLTSQTFKNQLVTPGTAYTYYVKASAPSGAAQTSNPVSVTTPTCVASTPPPRPTTVASQPQPTSAQPTVRPITPVPSAITPPVQPTTVASSVANPAPFQLSATFQCAGGSPEIDLSWTNSNGATRYDVYRNGSYLYNVLTSQTFKNQLVTPGTTYSYYVKASNASGGWQVSNTTTITASICVASTPFPQSTTVTSQPQPTSAQPVVRPVTPAPSAVTPIPSTASTVRPATPLSPTTASSQASSIPSVSRPTAPVAPTPSLPAPPSQSDLQAVQQQLLQKQKELAAAQQLQAQQAKPLPQQSLPPVTNTPAINPDIQKLQNDLTVAQSGNYGRTPNGIVDLRSNQIVAPSTPPSANKTQPPAPVTPAPSAITLPLHPTTVASVASPGPFQLSATPQCVGGSPEINLSWTKSNAAARYDVYRNGSYLYNVLTSQTFKNQLVTPGTAYTYYVKASTGSGGAQNSNPISVSAPTCVASTPPPRSTTVAPQPQTTSAQPTVQKSPVPQNTNQPQPSQPSAAQVAQMQAQLEKAKETLTLLQKQADAQKADAQKQQAQQAGAQKQTAPVTGTPAASRTSAALQSLAALSGATAPAKPGSASSTFSTQMGTFTTPSPKPPASNPQSLTKTIVSGVTTTTATGSATVAIKAPLSNTTAANLLTSGSGKGAISPADSSKMQKELERMQRILDSNVPPNPPGQNENMISSAVDKLASFLGGGSIDNQQRAWETAVRLNDVAKENLAKARQALLVGDVDEFNRNYTRAASQAMLVNQSLGAAADFRVADVNLQSKTVAELAKAGIAATVAIPGALGVAAATGVGAAFGSATGKVGVDYIHDFFAGGSQAANNNLLWNVGLEAVEIGIGAAGKAKVRNMIESGGIVKKAFGEALQEIEKSPVGQLGEVTIKQGIGFVGHKLQDIVEQGH